MTNLKTKRLRRSKKTRKLIDKLGAIRLSVHRTNLHIYAQLIDGKNNKVLTSASTLEPEVRQNLKTGSNISAATIIGKRIAEKGKEHGITTIAFDRAGYKYHGRVKALADAARENGLKF
ncbi:50S ribosomal protein L18 [Nitrosomonas sp. JL21]|uniref:50S ribosomal protein L18 n=1 Tax=Nitrosomonas sp. JL21 TaxID=153949 RepID=UPI00136CB7EE|nr:50S ribosomal protein L18 [Nitrosomonas sp. JL21]MBL8498286.1 50S ribosomal protein L18 [Nitrosomonas sp.]MXS77682.1 50S ribosomal protein L18 [Nitrosomonas sp. JL21]